MGRPVPRHASTSVQGGARVPLLAGVCASRRNPRSARLAGPAGRSRVAIPCTAHPSGLRESDRTAAPVCALLRRCEHHTGRSALPKPTRSRSAQPSWRICGALLSAATRSDASSFLLVRVRISGARDAIRSDRTALHTKVLCPVSERPYRRLDGTRAPDGMARSPRRPRPLSPPAEPIPSVWQHCLVDCTQRSSTLWRKARLMKHIARVKYGGILAVAYDERRRLVIDRTIRKWRNSALRYRAVSMWRYDFPRPCVRAEACGLPAAEHSQLGCST